MTIPTTNPPKSWLKLVAGVILIATVLLVCGVLTADQWLSMVKGFF